MLQFGKVNSIVLPIKNFRDKNSQDLNASRLLISTVRKQNIHFIYSETMSSRTADFKPMQIIIMVSKSDPHLLKEKINFCD